MTPYRSCTGRRPLTDDEQHSLLSFTYGLGRLGEESVEVETVHAALLLVYRDMAGDEDGFPLVGPHQTKLGVRTGAKPRDITADADGYVEPAVVAKGGMSVAPYDPANLSDRHRPPELNGGLGSYPVWEFDTNHLGPALHFRQTSATHGVIEPAYRMTLIDYEEALGATRKGWTRVIG